MAVIKYRVEATITRTQKGDERNTMGSVWQYEELYNVQRPGKLLSRDEAMDIINSEGLVVVHRCKYGVIYDKPDEPFLQKNEGYYSSYCRRR